MAHPRRHADDATLPAAPIPKRADPDPPRLTELFAVPGYVPLFIGAWLWHTTMWCGLFSASYLIATRYDAPLLNQLAGAFVFAPMLVGGVAAGVVSDRFDRLRIVLTTQLVLIPIAATMFLLVRTGAIAVWMLFPFMFALGSGILVNITAQRPLFYETVGPRLAPKALALDAVGIAAASVTGTFLGGMAIQAAGIEAAFAYIALAISTAALLLFRVRRVVPRRSASSATPVPAAVPDPVTPKLKLHRRNPPLLSLLGVTVVMHLCCFSFLPLVPVIAQRFGTNAAVAGALGAAMGLGQMATGIVVASRAVVHRGRVYVGGSVVALGCLALFALAPFLALSFIALLLAGIGQGGFASMQGVLALESAAAAERGAAQGLVSTAIGAMPVGMILVGLSAEAIGPQRALAVSSVIGLALLGGWLARRPHVLRLAVSPAD